MTSANGGAVPTGRHRRADAARGGCVLLVVLHHLTTKQYGLVVPEGLAWAEDLWLGFTWSLKPLRMPLFLVLSGFFSARALARPWRDTLGTRVVGAYLLYAMGSVSTRPSSRGPPGCR